MSKEKVNKECILMKHDSNPEKGKKPEKAYVNKQLLDNDSLGLVTLDNTRKELLSIEKKCEKNRIKYDYLSGKNIKRLMEEYYNGLHDESYGEKCLQNSKLSGVIELLASEPLKPSPPIPKTSSAIVGWRSSMVEYNLEIFGPLYTSPRHTIISLTTDEIPQQRFIYLG